MSLCNTDLWRHADLITQGLYPSSVAFYYDSGIMSIPCFISSQPAIIFSRPVYIRLFCSFRGIGDRNKRQKQQKQHIRTYKLGKEVSNIQILVVPHIVNLIIDTVNGTHSLLYECGELLVQD